jgi:hypothetical protein
LNQTEYRRAIHELCRHTGIAEWEDVATLQHLDVDGTLVGLMYDDEQPDDSMQLYFDLGPAQAPDLYMRLLQANVSLGMAGMTGSGYFGLHPENDAVVYRSQISLHTDATGADFAARLQECLDIGRQRLQIVLANQD